jgi:hypothetical protein
MQDWFENKDVALVGSSGALMQNTHGDSIDCHEVVCRINRGIIIINPKSQGTRTDVWAIGTIKTVEDLFEKYNVNNFYMSHKGRRIIDNRIDYYMSMEVLDRLRDDLSHQKPSSGLMALYYIQHCKPKQITIYGFDWKRTGTWYYEETNYQPHDWQLEEKYVREMNLRIVE